MQYLSVTTLVNILCFDFPILIQQEQNSREADKTIKTVLLKYEFLT
jgi:hypothetical protein